MLRAVVAATLVLVLSACTSTSGGGDQPGGSSGVSGSTSSGSGGATNSAGEVIPAAPRVGACRPLQPKDIAADSNATTPVPCTEAHTSQTFYVGAFPGRFTKTKNPNDPALGAYVFTKCNPSFRRFVGANDSLMLRTTLSWAWFRPSDDEWSKGARWWRCDVVGGQTTSPALLSLPKTAKGLLLGRPDDRWLICVDGPSVAGATKIPCSQRHTWRAVTTIVVGSPQQKYPGDRLVEVRSRDFCSNSVGAWLNYPVGYDYAYTYFHRTEWKAGNRRSVCWAKTNQ